MRMLQSVVNNLDVLSPLLSVPLGALVAVAVSCHEDVGGGLARRWSRRSRKLSFGVWCLSRRVHHDGI